MFCIICTLVQTGKQVSSIFSKGDVFRKDVETVERPEVAFTTFKGWCDSTATNKQKAIKEAEELMEQFEADIAAAESDVTKS